MTPVLLQVVAQWPQKRIDLHRTAEREFIEPSNKTKQLDIDSIEWSSSLQTFFQAYDLVQMKHDLGGTCRSRKNPNSDHPTVEDQSTVILVHFSSLLHIVRLIRIIKC